MLKKCLQGSASQGFAGFDQGFTRLPGGSLRVHDGFRRVLTLRILPRRLHTGVWGFPAISLAFAEIRGLEVGYQ